jgi:adenosylcobinamide-GDP ribazoletransferase
VRTFPYARKDGLGAGLRDKLAAGPLVVAVLTTLIAAGGMGMIWGAQMPVAVTLAGVAFALLFGAYASARLGGVTGDVYGATVELSEIVCLLAAALI